MKFLRVSIFEKKQLGSNPEAISGFPICADLRESSIGTHAQVDDVSSANSAI